MPNSDATRIALLEQEAKALRLVLDDHEKRHDEFMLRTDKRTETIEGRFSDLIDKLDTLIAQSNEWAGVRKALAAIVTVLTLVGGFGGWILAHFWPPK